MELQLETKPPSNKTELATGSPAGTEVLLTDSAETSGTTPALTAVDARTEDRAKRESFILMIVE